MFTIQYQGIDGASHMQVLESTSRTKLYIYLSQFPHPILAVYEQSTSITGAVRRALADVGNKSKAAQDFASSQS